MDFKKNTHGTFWCHNAPNRIKRCISQAASNYTLFLFYGISDVDSRKRIDLNARKQKRFFIFIDAIIKQQKEKE